MPAVGAERHPHHGTFVSAKGLNRPARTRVPDHHGRIKAPRSDASPVGAEGHGDDRAVVPAQGMNESARRRVPDLHGLLSGRGEVPAVGAERQALTTAGRVRPQGADHTAGRRIPDASRPARVARGQPAPSAGPNARHWTSPASARVNSSSPVVASQIFTAFFRWPRPGAGRRG